MIIDDIYINEAKRIRKVYLTNIANIVKKEDDIQKYFNIIENIKQDIDNNEENTDEEFFMKKLYDINDKIEKIKNHLMPYYENIKKLDKDQRILYNNIREKYPNITDDEIQQQIVEHVVEVDKEFTEKNKDLYNKILEKQK